MSNDEPITLCEGIEVSAKFHGAFCEAKIQKVAKNVKIKVTLKDIGKSIEYDDSLIHGVIKVGTTVQVDFGTPAVKCEAVVNRITDNSLYTVVYNDGDVETLSRAKLRLKGDKHFRGCSTLDGLPLTHPEHFWSPVKKHPKTKSSSAANTCSESDSDGEHSSDVESKALKKTYSVNRHQNLLGKVVCLDVDDRNKKSITVPVLVVLPGADDMQMPSKYHILVKSFKDNKFLSTTINNAKEFNPGVVSKIADKTLKFVYDKALQYHEKKELPPSWDGMELLGIGSDDSSDSDDEPDEKKDQFVASVYSHFEERGNPLSKTPAIKNFENVELNLYKLSNIVQNLGGYKRVSNLMKWHVVLKKMNLKNDGIQSSHIKAAYKEYLHDMKTMNRKLGCTLEMSSQSRSAGRSLVSFREREHDPTPKSIRGRRVTSTKEEETIKTKTESVSEQSECCAVPVEPLKTEPTKGKISKKLGMKKEGGEIKNEGGESEITLPEAMISQKINPKPTSENKGGEMTKKTTEKKEDQLMMKTTRQSKDEPASRVTRGEFMKIKEESKVEKLRGTMAMTKLDSKECVKKGSETTVLDRLELEKEEKTVPVLGRRNLRRITSSTTEEVADDVGSTVSDKGSDDSSETGKLSACVEDGDERPARRVSSEESYAVGTRLKVKYGKGKNQKTYEAKILEAEYKPGCNRYKVHYSGWNSRYDEWIIKDVIMGVIEEPSADASKSKSTLPATSKLSHTVPRKKPHHHRSVNHRLTPVTSSMARLSKLKMTADDSMQQIRSDSTEDVETFSKKFAKHGRRTRASSNVIGREEIDSDLIANAWNRLDSESESTSSFDDMDKEKENQMSDNGSSSPDMLNSSISDDDGPPRRTTDDESSKNFRDMAEDESCDSKENLIGEEARSEADKESDPLLEPPMLSITSMASSDDFSEGINGDGLPYLVNEADVDVSHAQETSGRMYPVGDNSDNLDASPTIPLLSVVMELNKEYSSADSKVDVVEVKGIVVKKKRKKKIFDKDPPEAVGEKFPQISEQVRENSDLSEVSSALDSKSSVETKMLESIPKKKVSRKRKVLTASPEEVAEAAENDDSSSKIESKLKKSAKNVKGKETEELEDPNCDKEKTEKTSDFLSFLKTIAKLEKPYARENPDKLEAVPITEESKPKTKKPKRQKRNAGALEGDQSPERKIKTDKESCEERPAEVEDLPKIDKESTDHAKDLIDFRAQKFATCRNSPLAKPEPSKRCVWSDDGSINVELSVAAFEKDNLEAEGNIFHDTLESRDSVHEEAVLLSEFANECTKEAAVRDVLSGLLNVSPQQSSAENSPSSSVAPDNSTSPSHEEEHTSTKSDQEANLEVKSYMDGGQPGPSLCAVESPSGFEFSTASNDSTENSSLQGFSADADLLTRSRKKMADDSIREGIMDEGKLSQKKKRRRKGEHPHHNNHHHVNVSSEAGNPEVKPRYKPDLSNSDADNSNCHLSAANNSTPAKLIHVGSCKTHARSHHHHAEYNFLDLEDGKYLEGEDRIDFLMNKIQNLRTAYMELKAEVACIDRRRRRHRIRDKDTSQTSVLMSPSATTATSMT